MSTTTLSLEEHTLGIVKVSSVLDELERRLDRILAELDACTRERRKFHLLDTILDALDELNANGAADLFWNHEATRHSPDKQLRLAREHVAAFHGRVAEIELQRDEVQREIEAETGTLRRLNIQLLDLEEEDEDRRNLLPVTREGAVIPYRPLVMPWVRNGEDDRRYRKVMLASLVLSISVGTLVLWMKPGHQAKQEEYIPEHVAELVVKKKEEPKKPEKTERSKGLNEHAPTPKAAAPARPQPTEHDAPEKSPGPATDHPEGAVDAQQVAKASVQGKGVLAHQNELAGLIDSNGPVKPGAEGVVSNTGQVAAGTATTRSLIVSQVAGGSGGINVAAISRNGDGGGGAGGSGTGTGGGGGGNGRGGSGLGGGGARIAGGGGGVKVAKVQSTTGAAVADQRPLSATAGPSRTDEEIQIVFDRYKAALYRIYNRELRNDPSLKGKMVLKLTIEPDGHVSACAVKSTDLNSAALSADVVERVLKFNFGAKAGVPAVTIVYPIDFLPAS